ncbi:MAG: phytoene desaturase [Chitinispirillaceae bacterium]|nr:phytoene desaturase [Chitinispirillaceae bacterium]
MAEKHIAIIGAGPGGLTAGMILAKRGYKVSIFEKEPKVGGRNASIEMNGYSFDIGPTFLMMTFTLREMFEEAGRSLDDYCKVTPLDPMYKLSFEEYAVYPSTDKTYMKEQIAKLFPGNEKGVDLFHRSEKTRYDKMYPCLKKDYSTFKEMFSADLIKALPYLSLNKSLIGALSRYFTPEELQICFTFQAKYIGMSPWECPAAFAIMPYIEHSFGVDHVEGGLSKISDAMAKVVKELGGEIHLNTAVKKVLVDGKNATGIVLAAGDVVNADSVVINADFGHAMETLFDKGIIKKWTPEKLRRKKYSCSTFMLYLGVDKIYDEPHHQIVFARDYKENVKDIISRSRLSEDMSIYVRNASKLDPTIAPQGHSALYVLVPTPNMLKSVSWDEKTVEEYRDKVIKRISERTSMKDLNQHITCEKIISPADWQNERSIFLGATFNLGHNITQMLYMRPRNKFEEIDHCYLVGGGTHPGSGLPTIYESARISASLIDKYENQ